MSITAKELAQLLGLSPAAVSMALNSKPGVSRKTRQLVLEAAQQYGYDFTRVSQKRRTTGSIYFVIFKSTARWWLTHLFSPSFPMASTRDAAARDTR